jgi:DNA-binding NarL/FixJ family response regulator
MSTASLENTKSTSPKVIRVLIADDHPVFRYGLKALLATEEDIELVGEANDGVEAVQMAKSLEPDVVLMDINMPGMKGIEATREISKARPEIGIVIITMLDDDSVFAAMRSGARGYLLKGVEGEETLQAIRAVGAGGVIFSPGVAARVSQFFAGDAPEKSQVSFPELTPREREILVLIAQGLTNNAIAERLVLSPKTVRNHVSTIYSKLQVASRAEAVARARDAGLGGEA